MTGIIKTDTIENISGTISIPATYFKRRILQKLTWTYRQGWWRGDNTYRWIPGCYADFVPLRGDSKIRVSMNIPARNYGSAHSISHWIFYRDNQEIGKHSRGGHHIERADTMEYEIPSWGEGQSSRVGYMMRSYAAGNHNLHLYHSDYWDGAGSDYTLPGQFRIEEFVDVT